MIESLIKSLIYTIIIELPIAMILGVRDKDDIKVVILAQTCTNPAIVFITNCVLMTHNFMLYWTVVVVLEVVVLFVERFIYSKCLKFKGISPFTLSFVCNVTSFSMGLVIGLLT